MDSITHGLIGTVIGRAGFERDLGKWAQRTGLVMALFPDTDFILRIFGEEFFLRYHRSITHSILFLPIFSLIFTILFVNISGIKKALSFYILCFLSLTSHIIFDLLTSFGTIVLAPLTDRRFSWDILFILDPYLTGIVLLSLLIPLFTGKYRQKIALYGLLILMLYVAVCTYEHHKAIDMGYKIGTRGPGHSHVEALPRPLSPFKWMVMIESEDILHQDIIDTWRGQIVEDIRWNRWPESIWFNKALNLSGVKFYMWFARFPVAIVRDTPEGYHIVDFMDLRFYIRWNTTIPFSYRVEFDKKGRVVKEGFAHLHLPDRIANHG